MADAEVMPAAPVRPLSSAAAGRRPGVLGLGTLSLTFKMMLPVAVMLVAALGVVAFAERSLHRLTERTHHVIEVTAARQALALGAEAAINSVAASEKNAMLMTDRVGLDAFASDYVTGIEHLRQSSAALRELGASPAERARLDALDRAVADYSATGERLYNLMVDRQTDEAHALSLGAAQDARERVIALVQEQVAHATAAMRQAETAADALYVRTVRLLIVLSVGGLIAAAFVASSVTNRWIVRPLLAITRAMRRLTEGDLAIEVAGADRRDEVGTLARALRVFREHSVAVRAHEAELRAARDAAILANRSKSQFLANTSHELRTPLNAVIGFAELLTAEVYGPLGDARYLSYARDIQGSGRHLLSIINDILDLAKIDAGQMALREGEVDVAALCHAALAIIRPKAWETGTVIECSDPPAPTVLWADERLLKQALLNLLSNAAKFSPAGARVELAFALGEDGWGEFRVADHGIGMRPDEIAAALEPFVQLDASLQRRYEGTGLGLPLTRRMAELHGGVLVIDSAPGRGTTAIIRLPPARIGAGAGEA